MVDELELELELDELELITDDTPTVACIAAAELATGCIINLEVSKVVTGASDLKAVLTKSVDGAAPEALTPAELKTDDPYEAQSLLKRAY